MDGSDISDVSDDADSASKPAAYAVETYPFSTISPEPDDAHFYQWNIAKLSDSADTMAVPEERIQYRL